MPKFEETLTLSNSCYNTTYNTSISMGIHIETIARVSKSISRSSCPSRTHPVAASSVQSTGLSYQSTASSLGTNISRLTGTPVDCFNSLELHQSTAPCRQSTGLALWTCINRLIPGSVDWSALFTFTNQL